VRGSPDKENSTDWPPQPQEPGSHSIDSDTAFMSGYGTIPRHIGALGGVTVECPAFGRRSEGTGRMAYRFLLEVPQTLAEAASIAVERVDDAQVLVARPSHGLGVDDPYVDMTVAAHSLRVVNSLFDWYESMNPPRPEVRMVLHGGERHGLQNVDRGRMVALIRRDQPWVERSIPHIGDHEPVAETPRYSVGPGAARVAPAEETAGRSAPAALVERERGAVGTAPTGQPAAALQIRAINYILVQVNDLRKAEVFYQDFFGMQLLGRVRRGPDGTLAPLPSDYSWDRALQTGELADTTFLSNGPLTLAVQSVGLGVILGQGALETVSIGVDSHTFAAFKGEVLMRPLTVLRSGVASFIFRDPFNINWEVAVLGSVPLIPV
jgi:catechol 2,3-dioxygenase-like lactoylglutathione lyase family enzyme